MGTAPKNRFLVALPKGGRKLFLGWRLLGTDAPDTPFHVERRRGAGEAWARVTPEPVLDSTTFIDEAPDAGPYAYRVVGADGVPSESVVVDAGAPASVVAMECPLNPDDHLTGGGIVVGELCNDGRLGCVVRSARAGSVWLSAFRHDGRPLWEFDTRLPARGGWDGSMNHVPFLCWDVNGDGRTECVVHTLRGGARGESYDTAGPDEYLTALDAQTGAPVWETPWPATVSRVMMTVGHLRGLDRPADVVVQDETYGNLTLTAVDGASGRVSWRVSQARPGGHNLDVADINGDGRQEVICGGVCYNGDGTVRWEAEPFGHTDISKPAKIDPAREGLQVWFAVESGNPGVYLVDRDGRTVFKEPFAHAHYGWVARHAPGVPGLHPHTAEDGRRREAEHAPIFLPDGSHWLNLTDWQRKNFVPVHWDEGPEVVFILRKDNKRVVRLLPGGEVEDLPEGKLPEGGQYGRNLACVDVVGDYRENIVTLDAERHRLVVLANATLAHRRGRSPWDSFEYRHDRSQHGSGYYIYLSPPDLSL